MPKWSINAAIAPPKMVNRPCASCERMKSFVAQPGSSRASACPHVEDGVVAHAAVGLAQQQQREGDRHAGQPGEAGECAERIARHGGRRGLCVDGHHGGRHREDNQERKVEP
jgi:hypothetical protein